MECYPECFSKVLHVLLECACVFVYASVFVLGALRVRVRPRATRRAPSLPHSYTICTQVLVVNSPSFFAMIWKLIKPFIPPRTAEKVGVHQKCCPSCTDVIEPCVLPAFLGGEFQGEWRMLPS